MCTWEDAGMRNIVLNFLKKFADVHRFFSILYWKIDFKKINLELKFNSFFNLLERFLYLLSCTLGVLDLFKTFFILSL